MALVGAHVASALNLRLRVDPTNGLAGYIEVSTNDYLAVTMPPPGTMTMTGLVANDIVKLHAEPQGANRLQAWYFSGTSAGASIENPFSVDATLIMGTNNTEVRAYFGSKFRLTMTNDPAGAGTTSPSEGNHFDYPLTPGNVGIVATPSSGWRFVGWQGAGIANAGTNSTQLTLTSDQTVIARYAPNRSITNRLFRGPEGPAYMVTNAPDGANVVLGPDLSAASSDPNTSYRCIGYLNAFGDIAPSSSTILSVGPFTVTTNSSITWNWIAQYRLRVTTGAGGTISVDGSDGTSFTLFENQTSFVFADSNTTFQLVASPNQGRVFAGWTGSSNSLNQNITFTLSGTRQFTASYTAADSDYDNDGMPDWWERRWGLSTSNPFGNNGPSGDPDGDGLSNLQEFNISSNMSPINYDTDFDGIDDYYETRFVDPTNAVYSGAERDPNFIPAALDTMGDGAYDANPDGDHHWNTDVGAWGGYELTFLDFMNYEEYFGPDKITPQTNVVIYPNVSDPNYPVSGAFLQPVRKMFTNPADTLDCSFSNRKDSDRDGLEDSFEYDWDLWQQANGGSRIVYTTAAPYIWTGITQTVPVWVASSNRLFNPNIRYVLSVTNAVLPDYDRWYSQDNGTVGGFFNIYDEQYASDFATGSQTLYSVTRLHPPPNTTENPPRWCTNPFRWDTDGDGLPDGWEVSFGYDPWSPDTDENNVLDGDENPDTDSFASGGGFKHHDVYVNFAFNPQTAWTGGKGNTVPFINIEELVGPGAMDVLNPYISYPTHPYKIDGDGDGIWDGWEFYVGLSPTNALDGVEDPDADGLVNLDEFRSFGTSTNPVLGASFYLPEWLNKLTPTDPDDPDTDLDQVLDGAERAAFNYVGDNRQITRIDSNTGVIVYSQFTGGGLNPCTWDTDTDFMPDAWEVYYAGKADANGVWGGGVNGSVSDALLDYDGDRLLNYQEYMTGAIMLFQYQYNNGSPTEIITLGPGLPVTNGVTPYDPYAFFDPTASGNDAMTAGGGRAGHDWDPNYSFLLPDESVVISTFMTQSEPPPLAPYPPRFSSTNPGQKDTDLDGMDDYWEIYHGLNPLMGSIDVVESKGNGMGWASVYGGAMVQVNPYNTGDWPYTDPVTHPWMAGFYLADLDQDQLPNIFESVQETAPPRYYHTDPSPIWVTDPSFSASWVNEYYSLGSFYTNYRWYWDARIRLWEDVAPSYMFSFEVNEGFDTDNDGFSDHAELVDNVSSVGSTDPINGFSPVKRRALALPGNAAARTEVDYYHSANDFLTFTVEAWVRPDGGATTNQTVVERAGYIPQPSGSFVQRANFRLALTATGVPYIQYDGVEENGPFTEAIAPATQRLVANQWYHLAGVYDGAWQNDGSGGQRWVGMLRLYINGILVAMTPSSEIPANGSVGTRGALTGESSDGFVMAMPIVVGASDVSLDMDGNGTWISQAGYVPVWLRMSPPPPYPSAVLANYFHGWVDDVRIWNGARSQAEITSLKNVRLTYETVKPLIGAASAQLKYCWTFDDLPDPDHGGIEPYGFSSRTFTPANFTGVNAWSNTPYQSQRYTQFKLIPWIDNLVYHLPQETPFDTSFVSSNGVRFPNTSNPYGYFYKTAAVDSEQLHPQLQAAAGISDQLPFYPDLLPLGLAAADEDVPMWDDGSAIQPGVFDSDGDGLPDYWEERYGLDPSGANSQNGADGDPDSDGLSNLYEYMAGTNPNNPDSDGDGVPDQDEDMEPDGLSNIDEFHAGTHPLLPDTDDDGIIDGDDFAPINGLQPLVDRVLRLNGAADSYIELPADPSFAVANFTLMSWVNINSNSFSQIVGRYLQLDATNGWNYRLSINANRRPSIMFTSGDRSTNITLMAGNSWTLSTGRWYHVAATYNLAQKRLSLFIDGNMAATMVSGRQPLRAIADATVTTRAGVMFNGQLEEVAIIGSALTDLQIQQAMMGMADYPAVQPRAYYRFDDGTSATNNGAGVWPGVSGLAILTQGQVMDCSGLHGSNWLTTLPAKWAHGATLHGSANIVIAPEEAPVRYGNTDSDGDGIPDWWEQANGLNSGITDAFLDLDQDGLVNYYEYLSDTDPNLFDSDQNGVGDYDSRDNATSLTYGELWDDNDYIPDAWEINYMGLAPNTGNRGLDPAYYDFAADPDADTWPNWSEYMGSYLNTNGALVRSSDPLNATNYPQPLVRLHGRYVGQYGDSLDEAMTARGGSPVRILFYATKQRQGFQIATLDMNSSAIATRQFTTGHLRNGVNFFFAYLDIDHNGEYDMASEPAGVGEFNLDWGDMTATNAMINEIEVPLSDGLNGYPRITWTIPAGPEFVLSEGTRVEIVYNNTTTVLARQIKRRNYLHEGDYLAAGLYGLQPGSYTMKIYFKQAILPGMSQWFLEDLQIYNQATLNLTTPVCVTPAGASFRYARNEVRWQMNTNATYYTLQISRDAGASIISSATRMVPYRDPSGISQASMPFYAKDGNGSGVTFGNGIYWWRIISGTPVGTAASGWRQFKLELNYPAGGGKSYIAGQISYFGKTTHGFGAGQINLDMIVQSFQSPGFNGTPDAQVQVTSAPTNTGSLKGKYVLLGLHPATQYVRAFIDLNGNRMLDAFEPWGFASMPGDMFTVRQIDFSTGAIAGVSNVGITIRERDTDDDGLPDGWEWMYFGTLLKTGDEIGAGGNSLQYHYEHGTDPR